MLNATPERHSDPTPDGSPEQGAYPHLEALIARARPGASTRRIERDAGIRQGGIAYYTKPSARTRTLPDPAWIVALAGALGVQPGEVTAAFLLDMGIPPPHIHIPPGIDAALRTLPHGHRRVPQLITQFGRLSEEDQERLLSIQVALQHAAQLRPDTGGTPQ